MALIDDVAVAALLYWTPSGAIFAVAIAGAESFFNPRAQGDPWWSFPADQQAVYLLYSCNGYTSIGAWQINMRWHYPALNAATGSWDPCVWATWLYNLDHSASLAHAIWESSGFGAWSTFNSGAYLAYLDAATVAVAFAAPPIGPPPGPLPPPGPVVPVEPPRQAVEPPWAAVTPPPVAIYPE